VTRVLLVDDQALVRAGFRAILDAHHDLVVVGEAADGVEVVDAVKRLRPDVVLMDIRMADIDGIEATRRLNAAGLLGEGGTRVVVLTTFEVDEYVDTALRAGASGFLLKTATYEELVHAVRTVAAGDALLAPTVTRRLIERYARRPQATHAATPEALARLTDREVEVLRLVARGLSNTEIARDLVVSEHTVKSHVSRLLAKLGLRDRAQAVVVAYDSGLIRPPPIEPV
jgi:DNA-binding NarL/FixJ family response regulator